MTTKNMFERVYAASAAKAHRAAATITGARSVVGPLRPADAKTLYDARVDCYLILAADILPDVGTHLELLESIQHAFCRRVLGLRKRSLLMPLFTELGIVQALRFLRYVAGQPNIRYVRIAMEEAILMYNASVPGWLGDLAYAMRRLKNPIELPETQTLLNAGVADELMRLVDGSMRAELQEAVQNHPAYIFYKTEPSHRNEVPRLRPPCRCGITCYPP